LGEWETPFWVGDENKGELRRVGFEAVARINRHEFGVSWQDEIPGGGVVVSNEVELALDVEAILLDDLERTGAIEYYRNSRPLPEANHPRLTRAAPGAFAVHAYPSLTGARTAVFRRERRLGNRPRHALNRDHVQVRCALS
jgi:hypothetical protein